MRSKIEVVGTFRLVLKFGLILDLENVFYVPSFSWNLISISRNVSWGFLFNGNIFSVWKNNFIIIGGTLIDSLYKIDLDLIF
jgi:hypothetical protein